MRLCVWLLAGRSAAVAAGQTGSPTRPQAVTASPARGPALPPQAFGVPLVRQQTGYSCGPAALGAVLKYFGVWDGTEQQLYQLVNTSVEEGTLPEDLAAGARHFGLGATVETSMTLARLDTLLASGHLVILELQAWRDAERQTTPWRDTWNDGHYVVLVALDEQRAYFMDPSTAGAYTFVPRSELQERWHDINPARPVPLAPLDDRLGVVISSLTRRRFPAPQTRRLLRME